MTDPCPACGRTEGHAENCTPMARHLSKLAREMNESFEESLWALPAQQLFDPATITFVTTVSDSGGPGAWTVHCGKLPDGRWVGWGPWQTKQDAHLLSKDQIDYYGLERIKKCPTCGHETR